MRRFDFWYFLWRLIVIWSVCFIINRFVYPRVCLHKTDISCSSVSYLRNILFPIIFTDLCIVAISNIFGHFSIRTYYFGLLTVSFIFLSFLLRLLRLSILRLLIFLNGIKYINLHHICIRLHSTLFALFKCIYLFLFSFNFPLIFLQSIELELKLLLLQNDLLSLKLQLFLSNFLLFCHQFLFLLFCVVIDVYDCVLVGG